MTTIAWDGQTLAGDKRTSFGGLHGTTRKIRVINDLLVGCAGNTAQIMEMHHWIANGRHPNDFPVFQRDADKCVSALVIQPDGKILQYENTPFPLEIENKQWAIGSGRDFALAAMHLGKTAKEAIEVASVFDVSTGNGVDYVNRWQK